MAGPSFRTSSVDGSSATFVDHACGACDPCSAGASLWCARPVAEGRPTGAPVPARSAEALLRALLRVAAMVELEAGGTVVVVTETGSATELLARSILDGTVLVGPSLSDPALRAEVAARETSGRSRVIAADHDVRAAVRAVRRGGRVCVPSEEAGAALVLPSVTELVQREVTLVGPRSMARVLERLSDRDWADLTAAA